jgi:hypothetical protein
LNYLFLEQPVSFSILLISFQAQLLDSSDEIRRVQAIGHIGLRHDCIYKSRISIQWLVLRLQLVWPVLSQHQVSSMYIYLVTRRKSDEFTPLVADWDSHCNTSFDYIHCFTHNITKRSTMYFTTSSTLFQPAMVSKSVEYYVYTRERDLALNCFGAPCETRAPLNKNFPADNVLNVNIRTVDPLRLEQPKPGCFVGSCL